MGARHDASTNPRSPHVGGPPLTTGHRPTPRPPVGAELVNLYRRLYSLDPTVYPPGVTMGSAPLTEVRERLSEIIDDVSSRGTEMTITKHGRPVAIILGFDEYESLIETLNILSDDETLSAIQEGLDELGGGALGS